MVNFMIYFPEVKKHFANIVYWYIELYKGLCIKVLIKYRPKQVFLKRI